MHLSVEGGVRQGVDPELIDASVRTGRLTGRFQGGQIMMQLDDGNWVPADAPRQALTNLELVQKSATLAERSIGGVGRFAGTEGAPLILKEMAPKFVRWNWLGF